MNVQIRMTDFKDLSHLILPSSMSEQENKSLDACVWMSQDTWIGTVNGQMACVWGLIPPSLLSEKAYLWLYTTKLIEEHKFLFVRHSQRWMEQALLQYPEIIGFTKVGNDRAIRWLKWLGGEISPEVDGRLNFVIRKRNGRSS